MSRERAVGCGCYNEYHIAGNIGGLHKFTRNITGSVELAVCTARVEGRWVGPRVLLHTLCPVLRVGGKNNIGGF